MRVGIGRPDNRHDITDYVLSKFETSEIPVIQDTVTRCCEALMDELHSFMNQSNATTEPSDTSTAQFQVQI